MLSTGVCRWLFLLISLSTWVNLTNSKEMRVVCYYTNWSVYRPGSGKFGPQNINPYLCTHLIYAFGGFTKENALKPFDKYQDIEKGGYAKFTGLKTYNKELKTMLAIGGWNEGSSRFSPMVASAERRKEFARNAIKFLRLNHFDGLDLDWEYPAFRDGGKPRDRDNYPMLVQELREEFDREAEKTGRPRLLLTMAVPAGIEYINKGFDVPKLTKYLDWMNILSYDFHSAFEPSVNHHAPLYPLEEESEYNFESDLNIDYAIKHYIKKGAEPSKLVLGIPTYGRSYTLYNPEAFEVGSPADGPGSMGEATRENGYLAYYEVCDYVKNQDWEVEKPYPQAMGPYAFKDNQWVGYDDEDIVRKKAHYVVEKGLGGIMFWSIDNDDFRGDCHGKPYPLIEAGRAALIEAYGLADNDVVEKSPKPIKSRTRTRTKAKTSNKNEESDVKKPAVPRRRTRLRQGNDDDEEQSNKRKTRRKNDGETSSYSSLKVVTPSYTTPAPPSTPELDGGFKCEDEGFYPHPKDCKKYFWCLNGAGDSGIVAHQFNCPAGLYFNKAADSCDYSQNVLCKKAAQKTTKKPDTSTTSSTTSSTTTSTTTPAARRITFPPRTTTRATTTTTTTEAYEDEEYEDEEEADEDKKGSEEDPRVIKELIELIKKAGGIAELEKQFNLKDNSSPNSEQSTTKSPIFSKSLYERVLSKAIKNTSPSTRNISFRNSRGPQSDRTEADQQPEKPERGKLQYTSISRFRSSTSKQSNDEESDQVKEENSKNEPVRKSIDKYPTYTSIRRAKSNFTTTEVHKDRNAILGESDDEEEEDEEEDEDTDDEYVLTTKRTYSPQYVNIRRQRPTTEKTSTSKYAEIQRGTTEKSTTTKEDASTTSKYRILRRTTTTTTNTPDITHDDISTRSRINGTTPTTTPNNTSYRSTTAQLEAGANDTDETINDYLQNVITTTGTYVTDDVNLVKSETNESKISQPNLIIPFPRKRPQLFEPRPFSKPTAATTRPPPIQVTKVSESPSEPGKPQRNVSFRSRGSSRFNANSSGNAEDKATKRRVIVAEKIQEENRNYRPSEIADLSSLTAVDFDNIKGLNPRTKIRRRRPTTTSTTTELPVENSQKRRRIHIVSDDPTTESINRFAHHNRKVIRRFRTSTIPPRIDPILDAPSKRNEVDEEIFEDATAEEEENIKLSESNIRENSEINGFRPDSKFLAKESYGKSSVFNDRRETPASSTETNLSYRTRKIVRKLTPTESSKIIDKETNAEQIFGRKRKVIRKIRPINTVVNNTENTKLFDPNEAKPPKRTFSRYRPTAINLASTTPRNALKNKAIPVNRSYRPTFKPIRNYISSESPQEPDTTTPDLSRRRPSTTTEAITGTEITTLNDLTTENIDTTSTDYTTTEHNPTEYDYTFDDLETTITTETESEATSITTEETTTSGVQDETTTLKQIKILSTVPSSTSKLFYNIRLRSTTSTTQPSVEKLNITNEISSTTKVINNGFNRYRSGYRPPKKINIANTTENTLPTPTSKLSYKFKKPREEDVQEVTSEKPKSRFLINKKTRTTKPSSLPYFTKSTTEAPVINEELKNIDTDAVKNRNKSLFSKNRKPNPLSTSTQPSTINEEAITDSMELSTEHPTTLVHIFAEKNQNASTEQPDKIDQNQTTTSRNEKLIEVNRIINVKTTEDVIKNHHLEHKGDKESSSLYDKIGSISRITVIKIVDKANNTDTASPVYVSDNQSTESPIKSSVDMIIQIAKIQQVPPPGDTVNVSVRLEEAKPSSREERRYDVIGIGKVEDSKSTNVGKAEIIDGISHINIITPRPAVHLTESSTIALEGLFQTDKPTLFAGKNSINEELLETDNSKYVNVRILHPDGSGEPDLNDYNEKKIIPIKLLKQDEDDAIMRARVVEISPKSSFNTIRIVPIRVEAAKKPPPPLPLIRINRQHN